MCVRRGHDVGITALVGGIANARMRVLSDNRFYTSITADSASDADVSSMLPRARQSHASSRQCMSEIRIFDYDPRWPRIFEELRATIWPAVSDVAVSIEHVGSTAVPGLAAKAVIDIDVIVPDDCVPAGIQRLTSIGYAHRGDQGIPQREAFRQPVGTPTHHLYLCPESSPALANHLAVRDVLRANAVAAKAYGDLKRRLAISSAGNVDAYVHGKTDFLVGLLRKAGFSESRLADIVRMNQS
jgi:GrpB-like predicted nucleotidyltransferase (UPF0157 family)